MPFLSGALSIRRYVVLDPIPASLPQTATLAMRRYAWQPINADRGEKESFGWVNPRGVLQETFDYEDVLINPYLFLGVRRDRKNFSKVLYKARREQKFAEVKKEKKLEKLSRQHRQALEEELTIEMLSETSPQSNFWELVWDMNTNVVYMGATGNTLCERIQETFEATFDLRLRPLYPAIVGAEFIASQGLEEEYYEASAAMEQTVRPKPQTAGEE